MVVTFNAKAKVNSRKHIIAGTTEDGYMFLIRQLFPADSDPRSIADRKILKKFKDVILCELTTHLSEETINLMFEYKTAVSKLKNTNHEEIH